MATTQYGVTGPWLPYPAFTAKEALVVTYFDGLSTALSLTGVGHLWWFWLLMRR